MNKILTVTSLPDIHLEMVQEHLKDEPIIFDPSLYPENFDISYYWNTGKLLVASGDTDISDVTSVWFRKPRLVPSNKIDVDKDYQDFAFSAYEHAVRTLYTTLPNAFWISDYWAIQKYTRNKILQIQDAYAAGMLVPETLVTSNPDSAKQFLYKHNNVITKALGIARVADQGLFMTTRINAEDGIDFDGLSLAPAIFQEEIIGVMDLRITVVGNKVFPCQIVKKGPMVSEVDWNVGTYTEHIEFGIHDLPEEQSTKCIDLVQRCGLKYGAIDLVMDKNGKYWFIEINPNGQWAFVEHETGLPISKAIADLLSSK